MPKKSTPNRAPSKKALIYRLHKVQIHENRWLAWTIAYAIIVTIVLVSYITITNIEYEVEPALSQFQVWHTYSSQALGFSLRYPSSWSVEYSMPSVINFIPDHSQDAGVSVGVALPSDEKSFRKVLHITNETTTTLDGAAAKKITNYIGKNNSETIILATHNNKLYVVRGTDNLVQKLLLTFQFSQSGGN